MKGSLPLFTGLFLLASAAASALPTSFRDSRPPRRVDVVIEAEIGRYTPDIISAQPGDTVHLTLRTKDIPHGFSVVGHDVDVVAMPGRPAEVTFVVNAEARMYEFYCTTFCGSSHGRMNGSLIVAGPEELE